MTDEIVFYLRAPSDEVAGTPIAYTGHIYIEKITTSFFGFKEEWGTVMGKGLKSC